LLAEHNQNPFDTNELAHKSVTYFIYNTVVLFTYSENPLSNSTLSITVSVLPNLSPVCEKNSAVESMLQRKEINRLSVVM